MLNWLCCLPRKDLVSNGMLLVVVESTSLLASALLLVCPDPAGRVLSLPWGPARCFLEVVPGELGTLVTVGVPPTLPAPSAEPTDGLRPRTGVLAGLAAGTYQTTISKEVSMNLNIGRFISVTPNICL